jgi:hypothetical protein
MMPPPQQLSKDDCDDVSHPAGQEWVEREMRRLSQNQHDLRESIHGYQLKHTVELGDHTRELADRITCAQKESTKEMTEILRKVEERISARVDKVEKDVAENDRKVDAVAIELNSVKVRVAMWCAVGDGGSVLSAIITAAIIHSLVSK